MINYSKLENQEPLDSRDESIKILEGRINKHTISGNDTQVNKLKKKLEELQKEPEHIPVSGKRDRDLEIREEKKRENLKRRKIRENKERLKEKERIEREKKRLEEEERRKLEEEARRKLEEEVRILREEARIQREERRRKEEEEIRQQEEVIRRRQEQEVIRLQAEEVIRQREKEARRLKRQYERERLQRIQHEGVIRRLQDEKMFFLNKSFKENPNNIKFRKDEECCISYIELNSSVPQLGCSECKHVFSKEGLERHLVRKYNCPLCKSDKDFYLV